MTSVEAFLTGPGLSGDVEEVHGLGVGLPGRQPEVLSEAPPQPLAPGHQLRPVQTGRQQLESDCLKEKSDFPPG